MKSKYPDKTLIITAMALTLTAGARAQVQTSSSVEHAQASTKTSVERGEVVYVSGNDLVVKAEDGTLRHFNNIPSSVTATVDGKQLTVHDLKPGMKLSRTITTTTTPRVVTSVQTVTGKVWQVTPPLSVILTLEDGTNQKFSIPKDQKFTVDGQSLDAFGLRKGMKIAATKVVESPETVVAQQRAITGTQPPPPPAPPADQPMLIIVEARPQRSAPVETASAAPPPEPLPAPAAPQELPKTGSELPLIGLLGVFSLGLAGALRLTRRTS